MFKKTLALILFLGLLLTPALFAQNKDVYRIGILSFESDEDLKVGHLSDVFATELLKTAGKVQKKNKVNFKILNRVQIDKILKESAFQPTGLTEKESSIQIGKLLNARYLILGRVVRIENETISYTLTATDAQTGEYVGGDSITVGAVKHLANRKQNQAMAQEIIKFILDPSYAGKSDQTQKTEERAKTRKNQVKLNWFYVTSSVIFEYWINHGNTISQISTLPNYPRDEERPKTFGTLKVGGTIQFFKKNNFALNLYWELPFIWNSVERYQDERLPDGQFTQPRSVFGLGDSSIGPLFSFGIVKTAVYLKLPSWIFGSETSEVRGGGGQGGNPWPDFGLLQIGNWTSISIKKHYLSFFANVVIFDPFANENVSWVIPGDFNLSLQYVYSFLILKQKEKNNELSLKPGISLDFSYYHWEGVDGSIYLRYNVIPQLSLSYLMNYQNEVSFTLSFNALSYKQVGPDVRANTRNITIGFYYGLYR